MPRFEPFVASRYSPELDLAQVSAPPYDVLSDADVVALRARHPANIVFVDVPRDLDGPHRYDEAAAMLDAWRKAAILVDDELPTLTLYRMRFTDEAGHERRTVGVLGALEVVDEGADGVLPHERTTPKAKTDRFDLTMATSTNLSPVWGLSLTAGLTNLLLEPGEWVGSLVDEAGVEHVVERLTDPQRISAICEAVAASPVLIADGHHRYAIARQYRDVQRQAASGTSGDAELTLTFVAELVGEQLSIDAIHRIYRGISADDLLDALEAYFDTAPAGMVEPRFATEVVERRSLCLVRPDGSGVWLTPRAGAFDGVRQLDGALLEAALVNVDCDVDYQHGVAATVDRVRRGDVQAAVLIRPTSIVEIRRTADERLLMPPKSTFFTPKLRTGLVLRRLDTPRSTTAT